MVAGCSTGSSSGNNPCVKQRAPAGPLPFTGVQCRNFLRAPHRAASVAARLRRQHLTGAEPELRLLAVVPDVRASHETLSTQPQPGVFLAICKRLEGYWRSSLRAEEWRQKMILTAYAAGWFVTTIGLLVAATNVPAWKEIGMLCVGAIAVAAGALWPLLIIGVIQLTAVAAVANAMSKRAALSEESGRQLRSVA